MKGKKYITYSVLILIIAAGFLTVNVWTGNSPGTAQTIQKNYPDTTMAKENDTYEVQKSEEEWRKELTDDEFRILREKGTEMPFLNKYYRTEKEGIYVCAACGQKLFSSETKYHSGSGWPAFYAPINKEVIDTKADNSMFMKRTEVLCSRCGSHLGHVFEDGPEPTGLRYCINSVAMDLKEKDME